MMVARIEEARLDRIRLGAMGMEDERATRPAGHVYL